jgi:hypothetical protein
MSWHPNDLVSDADLLAYEQTILTQFGQYEWEAKRKKALEDWLFPSLAAAGFDPYRLRTRYQAAQVWGYTSSAYTDYNTAAAAQTFSFPSSGVQTVAGQPFVVRGKLATQKASAIMFEITDTSMSGTYESVWLTSLQLKLGPEPKGLRPLSAGQSA